MQENYWEEQVIKDKKYQDVTMEQYIFTDCTFENCSFEDCRLEATQFFRWDIRKADFREAKGYVIDIPSNKLKQAKFSFPEVTSLLTSLEIKID